MFWQIFGMVLSGLISLVIAHFYYKKASKDLRIEATNLKKLNDELRGLITELGELDEAISKDTEIIRKNITKGTIDDPEYPNK